MILTVVFVELFCHFTCGICDITCGGLYGIILWNCLCYVWHYSVTLPVVVCMALYCGIACGMCHVIVLVLCLVGLFQLNIDALFHFVFVVIVYIY